MGWKEKFSSSDIILLVFGAISEYERFNNQKDNYKYNYDERPIKGCGAYGNNNYTKNNNYEDNKYGNN